MQSKSAFLQGYLAGISLQRGTNPGPDKTTFAPLYLTEENYDKVSFLSGLAVGLASPGVLEDRGTGGWMCEYHQRFRHVEFTNLRATNLWIDWGEGDEASPRYEGPMDINGDFEHVYTKSVTTTFHLYSPDGPIRWSTKAIW